MIAHLLSNRWNSAISEYALNAAKALHQVGVTQVFIALPNSPAAQRAKAAGLDVVEIERFSIGNLSELMGVFKERAVRAVFTYGGPETFLCKWLKAKNPALKVIRFRGDDRDARQLIDGLKTKLSQSHVDVLLAPSKFILNRLDVRGRLIGPGIDLSRLPQRREADPGPGKRTMITILGRLDPVKGHGPFFNTFAEMIRGETFPYVLNVVGEPANLSVTHLSELAAQSGLTVGKDVIIVPRRIEDISTALTSSCIGIISSLGSEIICRVAQEFLVSGTPILVSGVGSLPEYVFPGHGLNYSGYEGIELQSQIRNFTVAADQESFAVRESRAQHFREIFGLKALERALLSLLQDIGISI